MTRFVCITFASVLAAVRLAADNAVPIATPRTMQELVRMPAADLGTAYRWRCRSHRYRRGASVQARDSRTPPGLRGDGRHPRATPRP